MSKSSKPERFVTIKPAGHYHPAGLVIDAITVSHVGAGDPERRDMHVYFGVPDGDGFWLRVRYPNGIVIGMVRGWAELDKHLGIKPGGYVQVEHNFWPTPDWLEQVQEGLAALAKRGGRAA
jgi:hypothetical protein